MLCDVTFKSYWQPDYTENHFDRSEQSAWVRTNIRNEARRIERVRCVCVRLFLQMNVTSNIRLRISCKYSRVKIQLRLNNRTFTCGHLEPCASEHKDTHKRNTYICSCIRAQFNFFSLFHKYLQKFSLVPFTKAYL